MAKYRTTPVNPPDSLRQDAPGQTGISALLRHLTAPRRQRVPPRPLRLT